MTYEVIVISVFVTLYDYSSVLMNTEPEVIRKIKFILEDKIALCVCTSTVK